MPSTIESFPHIPLVPSTAAPAPSPAWRRPLTGAVHAGLLCVMLLAGGAGILSAMAQPTAPGNAPLYRHSGMTTIHVGIGSNNGARLGVMRYLGDRLAPEISAGYVRLAMKYETSNGPAEDFADAYSVTGGVSWFTHPDSDISPFFSLLVSTIAATEDVVNSRQQRVCIALTLGTEFYVVRGLAGFFRLGPSLNIISGTNDDGPVGSVHMDGGISISF